MRSIARHPILLTTLVAGLSLTVLVGAALAGFDPTFGNDGQVKTDFAGQDDSPKHAVLQPDGKIVVAGSSGGDLAVARYLPDGRLDGSFSADGRQTRDLGDGSVVDTRVAIDSLGNVVVAARTISGDASKLAVTRYGTDGELDEGFGYAGAEVDFGAADTGYGRPFVVDAEGRVAVARSVTQPGEEDSDFAVARLDATGELDESFGEGGVRSLDFAGYDDEPSHIDLGADQRIVVAGRAGTKTDEETHPRDNVAVARLTGSGAPDPAFSTDGRTTDRVDQGNDYVGGLAVRADGKVLISGSGGPSLPGFISRYDEDGTADESFGDDGVVSRTGGMSGSYGAVVTRPDGGVVAEFRGGDWGSASQSVDNYDGAGTFKSSENLSPDVELMALLSQPDGRVATLGGRRDFVLTRYDFARTNSSADLRVSVTDRPDPVRVNTLLKYTARIANVGPDRVALADLLLRMPEGADLVSVRETQGGCGRSRYSSDWECDLGSLGPGEFAEVEVGVRPRREGAVGFSASAGSEAQEIDSSDNGDGQTTAVSGPRADLALDVAARDRVRRGQQLTYETRIRNAGPAVSLDAGFRAKLSPGQRFVFAPKQCSFNRSKRTVDCSLGRMPKGAVRRPGITVEATRSGTIQLNGVVTSDTRDQRSSNNREAEPLQVK